MLPAKNTGCNRDHKRHILGYTCRTEKRYLKETKYNFSLDGLIVFCETLLVRSLLPNKTKPVGIIMLILGSTFWSFKMKINL